MNQRYYYQEEIFYTGNAGCILQEINQQKIVDLLFKNTAVGVVSGFYDEGLPIYFVSHFALNNLGYTYNEFMERTSGRYLDLVCPSDRNMLLDKCSKLKSSEAEYRLIDKYGNYIWVHDMWTDSYADDGRHVWVSSIRIVDDAHKAHREFVSKISHDIRTPLNVIISTAQLEMNRLDNNDKLYRTFESISDEGYHLLHEVNEALDLKSIETGIVKMTEEMVNIYEFVDKFSKNMKKQADKRKQRINISFKNIENTEIICDYSSMMKIFESLTSNALKYSEAGQHVDIIIEQKDNKIKNIADYCISFCDYGHGIEEKMLQQIFEPFEKVEDTRLERGKSDIGLGLSVTKKLIELMNGKISVSSVPGKGSTFVVDLSFKIPDEMQENQKANDNLEQLNILMAEDNVVGGKLLKELLELSGARVTHVTDGRMAVEKFTSSEGKYDVILMDIHMPVMDGYEATKSIRKLVSLKGDRIPVIAVTADSFEEDIETEFECGMNGHMSKPVDYEELKNVLISYKKENNNCINN